MAAENLQISPIQAAKFLLLLVAGLVLANCAGLLSTYYFGHDYLRGLVPLFNLDNEKNIPTLFSTLLILLCALLLLLVSLIHRRRQQAAGNWLLLAAIFLFLGIDEFCSLHERLITPSRELFTASGAFYFAWIIPYGIGVVLLALILGRFILALPAHPRRLMLVSASVYLSGAIGLEMVGGWYFENHDDQFDLAYGIITTLEESLEMVGLVIFVYALLGYIGAVHNGIAIRIGAANPTSSRRVTVSS